ncbi:MAG: hypothetical protein ABR521_02635 [Gaiellaceae bacterium]
MSKHVFRDSVIFYGVLAGLIVLITALTHGRLMPGEVKGKGGVLKLIAEVGAIPVAIAFFVLATGFSWWRLRKRAAAGGRR